MVSAAAALHPSRARSPAREGSLVTIDAVGNHATDSVVITVLDTTDPVAYAVSDQTVKATRLYERALYLFPIPPLARATSIAPLYRRLVEEGYQVTVSHPKKTRYIAEARIKTDRGDSRALARASRIHSDVRAEAG